MTEHQYQVGDTVDVEIKGAKVELVRRDRWMEMVTSEGYTIKVPTGSGGDWGGTVTRAAPAEWPPQAGDTWSTPDGPRQIFVSGDALEADDPHDSGFSVPVAALDPAGATLLFRLDATSPSDSKSSARGCDESAASAPEPDAYRDRDGDVWRRVKDGEDLWQTEGCAANALDSIREWYGPLTPVTDGAS